MYTGNTERCSFFITTYLLTYLLHYLLSKSYLPGTCAASLCPSVLWHCWFGVRKNTRPVKIELWGVGVVICLQQGADCLHMVQLMPLHPKTQSSLASFNSRLVLPFWYRLTQVVLKKRLLNGCSSVAVLRHSFNRPAIKARLAVPLLQVINIFTHSLAYTVLHWKNYGLVNNGRLLTTHCVLKSQLLISQSRIFGLRQNKRLIKGL